MPFGNTTPLINSSIIFCFKVRLNINPTPSFECPIFVLPTAESLNFNLNPICGGSVKQHVTFWNGGIFGTSGKQSAIVI